MSIDYEDRWIRCTADAIEVRAYYFPWGTKHIRYDAIRSVKRVNLGAVTGKLRLWGTANPGRWAGLDPRRATKKVGFDLDLGGSIKPLLTPDNPAAFEQALRAHLDPDVVHPGSRRSSLI